LCDMEPEKPTDYLLSVAEYRTSKTIRGEG